MPTFGALLKQFLQDADRSIKQLAAHLRVHRNTVGGWIRGDYPPDRARVLEIAEALYLSEDETDQLLAAAGYRLEYQTVAVSFLSSQSGRRDFYAHVSLPPNYVTRAEVLAEIRAAVLGTAPAIALTSAVKDKPTALHGMGGIGKSVLARALCDDPKVQVAFPDGILWATLGQTPDLITWLRDWIKALGGTISEHAPTERSLKANLADLLKERACLLILDDAWQRKHVEVFQVGGPRCRLLLTTRDAEMGFHPGRPETM